MVRSLLSGVCFRFLNLYIQEFHLRKNDIQLVTERSMSKRLMMSRAKVVAGLSVAGERPKLCSCARMNSGKYSVSLGRYSSRKD
jgi:hypothetical protein